MPKSACTLESPSSVAPIRRRYQPSLLFTGLYTLLIVFCILGGFIVLGLITPLTKIALNINETIHLAHHLPETTTLAAAVEHQTPGNYENPTENDEDDYYFLRKRRSPIDIIFPNITSKWRYLRKNITGAIVHNIDIRSVEGEGGGDHGHDDTLRNNSIETAPSTPLPYVPSEDVDAVTKVTNAHGILSVEPTTKKIVPLPSPLSEIESTVGGPSPPSSRPSEGEPMIPKNELSPGSPRNVTNTTNVADDPTTEKIMHPEPTEPGDPTTEKIPKTDPTTEKIPKTDPTTITPKTDPTTAKIIATNASTVLTNVTVPEPTVPLPPSVTEVPVSEPPTPKLQPPPAVTEATAPSTVTDPITNVSVDAINTTTTEKTIAPTTVMASSQDLEPGISPEETPALPLPQHGPMVSGNTTNVTSNMVSVPVPPELSPGNEIGTPSGTLEPASPAASSATASSATTVPNSRVGTIGDNSSVITDRAGSTTESTKPITTVMGNSTSEDFIALMEQYRICLDTRILVGDSCCACTMETFSSDVVEKEILHEIM